MSDYEIGYGRPPKKDQFQKGKSGNPRGRPKKLRRAGPVWTPPERELDNLTEKQLRRLVKAKINGKHVSMPVMEAMVIKVVEGALEGRRLCAELLFERMDKIKDRQFAEHVELVRTILAFKQHRETAKAWFEERGQLLPPHFLDSDDIEVDIMTGKVTINGPTSQSERDRLNATLEAREEKKREVQRCATEFNEAATRAQKDDHLMDWLFKQFMFDVYNDSVPERYKERLENRLVCEGASREGEALKQVLQTDWSYDAWARSAYATILSPEELERLLDASRK